MQNNRVLGLNTINDIVIVINELANYLEVGDPIN